MNFNGDEYVLEFNDNYTEASLTPDDWVVNMIMAPPEECNIQV